MLQHKGEAWDDGSGRYRHEVDVHADDRVELFGNGQADHVLHAHATKYVENSRFTEVPGKTAEGCRSLHTSVERVDRRRHTSLGVRLSAFRDALHLRPDSDLQIRTYALEITHVLHNRPVY